jgi:hypothetical protein
MILNITISVSTVFQHSHDLVKTLLLSFYIIILQTVIGVYKNFPTAVSRNFLNSQ